MSNFKSNLMDNFFKRPVGAAVLFLNDFHFGSDSTIYTRLCARRREEASILSNTTQANVHGNLQSTNPMDNDQNMQSNQIHQPPQDHTTKHVSMRANDVDLDAELNVEMDTSIVH